MIFRDFLRKFRKIKLVQIKSIVDCRDILRQCGLAFLTSKASLTNYVKAQLIISWNVAEPDLRKLCSRLGAKYDFFEHFLWHIYGSEFHITLSESSMITELEVSRLHLPNTKGSTQLYWKMWILCSKYIKGQLFCATL